MSGLLGRGPSDSTPLRGEQLSKDNQVGVPGVLFSWHVTMSKTLCTSVSPPVKWG